MAIIMDYTQPTPCYWAFNVWTWVALHRLAWPIPHGTCRSHWGVCHQILYLSYSLTPVIAQFLQCAPIYFLATQDHIKCAPRCAPLVFQPPKITLKVLQELDGSRNYWLLSINRSESGQPMGWSYALGVMGKPNWVPPPLGCLWSEIFMKISEGWFGFKKKKNFVRPHSSFFNVDH